MIQDDYQYQVAELVLGWMVPCAAPSIDTFLNGIPYGDQIILPHSAELPPPYSAYSA